MRDIFNKVLSFVYQHRDKFFMHYPIELLISVNCFQDKYEAAITAIIIGILKELIDKFLKKTYWSWGDILADSMGVLTGFTLRTLCGY